MPIVTIEAIETAKSSKNRDIITQEVVPNPRSDSLGVRLEPFLLFWIWCDISEYLSLSAVNVLTDNDPDFSGVLQPVGFYVDDYSHFFINQPNPYIIANNGNEAIIIGERIITIKAVNPRSKVSR